jgi:class 3 adenylate cyclase
MFRAGDSYVAVTGLPKPQERHALLMARFAWDCLLKFEELTRELEKTLGPDTTDLGIRFGMHSGKSQIWHVEAEKLPITTSTIVIDHASFLMFVFNKYAGPVTAGVLRGEKSRFQLFGDTVNTAARMESTGLAGRIQVSHATAHYLEAMNKQHWLQRREDSVAAKGKGVLETYWLIPKESGSEDRSCSSTSPGEK